MSARSRFMQLATKFSILVAALFVVTVLLSAMPGHHAPGTQSQESRQPPAAQSQQQQSQEMDPDMPAMDMDDAKANEAHAVHDMTPGHHAAHSAHMHMTAARPQTDRKSTRLNSSHANIS